MMQTTELVTLPEVLKRITASKTSLYCWIKSGTFPAPIKLGPRRVAWRVSDIDSWILSRGVEA